jgi:hypothetical protein
MRMIEIKLSKTGKKYKGYVSSVSDEDIDLTQLNWNVHAAKRSRTMYAVRISKGRRYFLHRVILARMLGRELIEVRRSTI